MTSLRADSHPSADQRIVLHGVRWEDYEAILAIRGDQSGVRLTYLEGELEFMSPSADHEGIKTLIGRLLEAWAEERDVELNGYGSWTVRERPKRRGIEPDECYVLGTAPGTRPDLAIEVIWTSGGIDKLDVYRGLGVPEVWLWRDGRIQVHALRGERYEAVDANALLPDLDLAQLASFLSESSQTRAVRAYRAALRGR